MLLTFMNITMLLTIDYIPCQFLQFLLERMAPDFMLLSALSVQSVCNFEHDCHLEIYRSDMPCNRR